jgi:hypothetical protein
MAEGPAWAGQYVSALHPARPEIHFLCALPSQCVGPRKITAGQLLPGILREDKRVVWRLGWDALIAIRKELEQLAPPKGANAFPCDRVRTAARRLTS